MRFFNTPTRSIHIVTDKPVAYDSPDHVQPWGTAQDNHTSPRFNRKLSWCIPAAQWKVLDIGCAGGGFVKSVLDAGGLGVGLEGSDYSKRKRRAEWATIPDHLFTADATVPFQFLRADAEGQKAPLRFNVITAWEFLEHIRMDDLPAVFGNIERHLEPGGIAVFSVADYSSLINGVELHQTIQPETWWRDKVADLGFAHHEEMTSFFGTDWVRGTDGSDGSFHLVLTRAGEDLPFRPRLPMLRRRAARERQKTLWKQQMFFAACRLSPRSWKEFIKRFGSRAGGLMQEVS